MAQIVEAPKSDSARDYTELAYLEGYDAVLDDDYAFVAYKEVAKSSGKWSVKIKSSKTAGASFDPDAMAKQARRAGAQDEAYFTWGYSFSTTEGDPRIIEFRVHQTEGKPSSIEMVLQLRKADGSAAASQTASFDWPE